MRFKCNNMNIWFIGGNMDEKLCPKLEIGTFF